MNNSPPFFSLDTSLDHWCQGIAEIYKRVEVSKYPLFRWCQFTNDVTILAEHVRRGAKQQDAAIEQVARILGRLLDFVGVYLYKKNIPKPSFPSKGRNKRWKAWATFSDFLAVCLKMKSYPDLGVKLPEGLSRWMLAKYPFACAKCGKNPCHCGVTPWDFEDRREWPGNYEKYRQHVKRAHHTLGHQVKKREFECFSPKTLFEFFHKIYRNSCYNTDPWKIVMHLSEEVGEATIELTRLELIYLAPIGGLTHDSADHILNRWVYSERAKFIENMKGGKKSATAKRRVEKLFRDLKMELSRLNDGVKNLGNLEKVVGYNLKKSRPEDRYRLWLAAKTSEKFKEEVSDIISWLVAIGCKLSEDSSTQGNIKVGLKQDKGNKVLDKFLTLYGDGSEQPSQLWCRRCKAVICGDKSEENKKGYSDWCLVVHSLGKELLEHVTKM